MVLSLGQDCDCNYSPCQPIAVCYTNIAKHHIIQPNIMQLKLYQDQMFDKLCYVDCNTLLETLTHVDNYIEKVSSDIGNAELTITQAINEVYDYLSAPCASLYNEQHWLGNTTVNEILTRALFIVEQTRGEEYSKRLLDVFLKFSKPIILLLLRMALCSDEEAIVSEGQSLFLLMGEYYCNTYTMMDDLAEKCSRLHL